MLVSTCLKSKLQSISLSFNPAKISGQLKFKYLPLSGQPVVNIWILE